MAEQHDTVSDTSSMLAPEVMAYYANGHEAQRLAGGGGQIEEARTRELTLRYLPPAPATILDVGGGPGAYALWLARLGYSVHLIDAVPLHVDQAREASRAQPDTPLASADVGDARQLTQADASADAVLLFGPLYHLIERADRIQTWREARRVTRAGGVILGVGISRYASTLGGFFHGLLSDPAFVEIVRQDTLTGQHRNPTNHRGYFTTTYFHHPSELRDEVEEAGLTWEATLMIEGPAWLASALMDHWEDAETREHTLTAIRLIEQEPSMLGATAHLMVVARKQ